MSRERDQQKNHDHDPAAEGPKPILDPPSEGEFDGLILKGVGGNYWVSDEEGHEGMSTARGIFRKKKLRPAAGDYIRFEATGDPVFPYHVLEIYPRKNLLPRPQVANIDQLFLVFAVQKPAPDFLLLDKLAAIASCQGMAVHLIFTKMDLAEDPAAMENSLRERFRGTGWPMHFSHGYLPENQDTDGHSCESNDSDHPDSSDEAIDGGDSDVPEPQLDPELLDEIRRSLRGKVTALAGPSGSGKSTLLNHLAEEAHMETGSVSDKLQRGRHTTRHTELFPIAGGYLVDTPGFSMLDITEAGIEPEALPLGFPEFFPDAYECRFNSCHHLKEPGCRVREKEDISPERYANYVFLREALDNYDPYR